MEDKCNKCEDGVILDDDGCLEDFCDCEAGRSSFHDFVMYFSPQGVEDDHEVPLR